MIWTTVDDVTPLLGFMAAIASIVCAIIGLLDIIRSIMQLKLWFPTRILSINSFMIQVIGISLTIVSDVTTGGSDDVDDSKFVSIVFFIIMLSLSLPSIGCMDDKTLVTNISAIGVPILIISFNLFVHSEIKESDFHLPIFYLVMVLFMLLCPVSVVFSVPSIRKTLRKEYRRLDSLPSNLQEYSTDELIHDVTKYWIMAETGNPQFVIACSPVCSCSPFLCLIFFYIFIFHFFDDLFLRQFWHETPKYKWSIKLLWFVQLCAIMVASIALFLRFLTVSTYSSVSKRWVWNRLFVIRVDKHCFKKLLKWKSRHLDLNIPSRHGKMAFHFLKNMLFSVLLLLQYFVNVSCNIALFVPIVLLILVRLLYDCYSKLSTKHGQHEPGSEYLRYAIIFDPHAKPSNRTAMKAYRYITQLIHKPHKYVGSNLMDLLQRTTGFNQAFDLYQRDQHSATCWSLMAVTLTAIAVSLPNIENKRLKGLIATTKEGLDIIEHVEDILNTDLEMSRKASRELWSQVLVYKWLQVDLRERAGRGDSVQEILLNLRTTSVDLVGKFKARGNLRTKFLVVDCMYRVTRTLMLRYNDEGTEPTGDQIFEVLSNAIAELICACMTNLPRVIKMKCREDAVDKREDSIRTAGRLLGKTINILKILEDRAIPNLDLEAKAYYDEWHTVVASNQDL